MNKVTNILDLLLQLIVLFGSLLCFTSCLLGVELPIRNDD